MKSGAKDHDSPFLREQLANISPLTRMQVHTKIHLAVRIENMIKERGWSKSEFAEKMKKRPSEITKWLSGHHNFTIDTLCEIAVVLGVRFRDLFEENKIQVIETKLEMNVPPSDFKYPMFEKSSVVEEPQMEYSASILNKEDKRIRNSETPGDVLVALNTTIKSIEILESAFRMPQNYDKTATIVHFDVKFETGRTTIPGEIRSVVTVSTHVEKFLLEVGKLRTAFVFEINDPAINLKSSDHDQGKIPEAQLTSVHAMALSTMRGMLYSQWRGTFLHHAILPDVDVNNLNLT